MRRSNYLHLSDKELDSYIYRIVSIDRLIEIYKVKENALVKPSAWDDPFENFILKSKVRQLSGEIIDYGFHNHFYGQCWTLHKASDAMWRIYSPDKNGVRIRTTVRKLASSLTSAGIGLPDATCYIGKVRYLSNKKLTEFSNSVYEDGSVAVDSLFESLLVKRRSFSHEKEVRLLYGDVTYNYSNEMFAYSINPNELFDQLMIDPRKSHKEFKSLKAKIQSEAGATCMIKRSLLYAAPEEIVLDVK